MGKLSGSFGQRMDLWSVLGAEISNDTRVSGSYN